MKSVCEQKGRRSKPFSPVMRHATWRSRTSPRPDAARANRRRRLASPARRRLWRGAKHPPIRHSNFLPMRHPSDPLQRRGEPCSKMLPASIVRQPPDIEGSAIRCAATVQTRAPKPPQPRRTHADLRRTERSRLGAVKELYSDRFNRVSAEMTQAPVPRQIDLFGSAAIRIGSSSRLADGGAKKLPAILFIYKLTNSIGI